MIAAKLFSILTLAAGPALATVVVTQPVASTTGHGGKKLTVEWNNDDDDGSSPKISDWGNVNIYLATGSHNVQFHLQQLAEDVDASKTRGRYRIDPSVGPDGGFYFLRFQGSKPVSGNTPPLAFSARFTLVDMTGSFNQTILSELSSPGGTATAKSGSATRISSVRPSSTSTAPTSTGTTRPNTTSTNANSTSGAASTNIDFVRSATLLTGVVAAGLAFL